MPASSNFPTFCPCVMHDVSMPSGVQQVPRSRKSGGPPRRSQPDAEGSQTEARTSPRDQLPAGTALAAVRCSELEVSDRGAPAPRGENRSSVLVVFLPQSRPLGVCRTQPDFRIALCASGRSC